MAVLDLDAALAALDRLLAIARSDTGQSRRVANFLLAWWNAGACGGFDLTVARLIALKHEYPTAYDRGAQFEALVAAWRPHRVAPPETDRG